MRFNYLDKLEDYNRFTKESRLLQFSPSMSPRQAPFSAGSFYKTFELCHVKSLPALKNNIFQNSLPILRTSEEETLPTEGGALSQSKETQFR